MPRDTKLNELPPGNGGRSVRGAVTAVCTAVCGFVLMILSGCHLGHHGHRPHRVLVPAPHVTVHHGVTIKHGHGHKSKHRHHDHDDDDDDDD